MMPYELQQALEPLLDILQELDGYFVLKDANGNDYILGRVEDILAEEDEQEVQLPLPSVPSSSETRSFVIRTTADELLDKINREIALFQLQQEDSIDDLGITEEPVTRVRFEALKGDLPPELQE